MLLLLCRPSHAIAEKCLAGAFIHLQVSIKKSKENEERNSLPGTAGIG